MKTLHGTADRLPGESGPSLSDPDEEQGEEAEEDMGGDPVILPVVERPQIEGGLQRAEGPLPLLELFVAQCDVFGRERIVAGGEDIFAVEVFLARGFRAVDLQSAVLLLTHVAPHNAVGQERANTFGMSRSLERGERLFGPCEDCLPLRLVSGRLFRVVNDDTTSASFSIADDHLFHLEVLPDLAVSACAGKGLFMNGRVVPQLLPQNILAACLLQDDFEQRMYLSSSMPPMQPLWGYFLSTYCRAWWLPVFSFRYFRCYRGSSLTRRSNVSR